MYGDEFGECWLCGLACLNGVAHNECMDELDELKELLQPRSIEVEAEVVPLDTTVPF